MTLEQNYNALTLLQFVGYQNNKPFLLLFFSSLFSLSLSLSRPHRWPQPLHITCLGGVRRQLLEAKRRGLGGEAGVFEEAARLKALLLQGLVVLVEEVNGLLVGTHPLCLQPVCGDVCRYPSVRKHTGADKNTTELLGPAVHGWGL